MAELFCGGWSIGQSGCRSCAVVQALIPDQDALTTEIPGQPAISPCSATHLFISAAHQTECGRSSGVEHNLAKVRVESSNLFARSSLGPISYQHDIGSMAAHVCPAQCLIGGQLQLPGCDTSSATASSTDPACTARFFSRALTFWPSNALVGPRKNSPWTPGRISSV
jgi:hypothetical protein